jgi:signal transduction histidine kinase
VTIELRRRDDGVEVVVADTGRGVSPADLPRVFEPFFTTKKRAAGLGLAVSRQIAARHGGDITLRAPAEGGAVVTITLPLAPPAAV